MGRRFALIVVSLGAASVLSIITLEVRIHEAHSDYFRFLLWNLFLAWGPLIAASLAFALARRGATAAAWIFGVAWLLLFPNAPYMLTDFIHLHARGALPLWYDALMLSSFSWTALMLGFVSLFLIHTIVARRAGAAVGWVMVVCVLALGSFGVSLGRFARFNSWDVVTRPGLILSGAKQEVDSLLHEPKMAAALLALTAFLFVGYLVLYAFSALGLELAED